MTEKDARIEELETVLKQIESLAPRSCNMQDDAIFYLPARYIKDLRKVLYGSENISHGGKLK